MKKESPPVPISKAFLICRQVLDDPKTGEPVLVGLPQGVIANSFPSGQPLGVFARWTSAHGDYRVEVQLQTAEGAVVWRDGPPEPWPMRDPLRIYDLKLNLIPVFPAAGMYDIVLLANEEEVARQFFQAQLAP